MTELLDLTQCEDFFGHCPVHAAHPPRECQLNFFDLSTHTPCCALCVAAQPLDTYIQASQQGRAQRQRPAARRGGAAPAAPGQLPPRIARNLRPQLARPVSSPAFACPPGAQVRRSSYHDVVKVQDISRFADISGVQGALGSPGWSPLPSGSAPYSHPPYPRVPLMPLFSATLHLPN